MRATNHSSFYHTDHLGSANVLTAEGQSPILLLTVKALPGWYDPLMTWPGQDPPATDPLIHLNVPCSGGGTPAYLEIDKLPDGRYRATVGTLFEYQEICRTRDLETLIRHADKMAACRSFDDIVHAFRAMRTLNAA